MGADDSHRQSRTDDRSTPHLPRHVIEHIGQVLRNRYRNDLLVPVPSEMLKVLDIAGQGSTPALPERKQRV
jgi:hypothetical protein